MTTRSSAAAATTNLRELPTTTLSTAVFNDDNTPLTITDSRFTQNVVQTGGSSEQADGGAISADDGTLVVINGSSIDHNQVIGTGGL